jgi:putative PEP-CTERM system histidine kinase
VTLFSYLPFVAALLSLSMAVVSLLARKHTLVTWCFFAGMTVLGLDSLITGLTLRVADLAEVQTGVVAGMVVESFAPAAWLFFSFVYSRGNYRKSLQRWGFPVAALALLPIVLALFFRQQLVEIAPPDVPGTAASLRFGEAARMLTAILLVAFVLVVANLEQTFRSAVGTMRWRIKFVVLGLAVIFGTRIYVLSQTLLFPAYDTHWSGIECSALLIGCMSLALAHARTGFTEIDVYPSRAVLGSSVTILISGGYLLVIGVLANVVRRFGGAESFQLTAFVVLLGMAGLAALLLSDRLRQRIHTFVARHFTRAQYDSGRIWTESSRRFAAVKDQAGLCAISERLVAEVFEVLSVSIWLLDHQSERLSACASTSSQPARPTAGGATQAASSAVVAGLRMQPAPFDLDAIAEPWGEELRRLNPATFANGGHRWCVPLRAGDQTLGALVLADRVNGASYTVEELSLLRCISDQVTSVLLNLRLADELARSRELEAFRTMSAFFVHDLKNAAASLNLMLKNLPVHFDDPAFRQDALRAIGNTARRIDDTIARLTELRQRPVGSPVEADLNQLVADALEAIGGMTDVELTKDLHPVPAILADRAQIQSVVTNLVLNARDAVTAAGRIRVRTEPVGGAVVLTVADNGCGMNPAFVRDSLFRPFQTTKKKGLGIGMFQTRMIVEAHGGSIGVESEAGKGSTFRVVLPAKC